MKTKTAASCRLPVLAVIFAAAVASAAGEPLFSENLAATGATNDQLTERGWNILRWVDAIDTTTYATPTTVSDRSGNSAGISHPVSGLAFDVSGISYAASATVVTPNTGNASSGILNNGNRFFIGFSSGADVTDSTSISGIYAVVGDGATTDTITIAIMTGSPVGANTLFAATSVSGQLATNTACRVELRLSSVTATATLYSGSTVLLTTTYDLAATLTGTPYGAVTIAQRNSTGTNALPFYFSDINVTSAIPEPKTAAAIVAAAATL
ncbi:MAG: hypothetical protein LBK99_23675, partial [Opitutaceae bacterium]|nr:hypothetical protein [Opitutaceae bacterium]